MGQIHSRPARALLYFVLLLAALRCVGTATACTAIDTDFEHAGRSFKLQVPDDFNGTLVYGAHGYDRSGILPPFTDAVASTLLGSGFALVQETAVEHGWTLASDLAVARSAPLAAIAAMPECTVEKTLVSGIQMGGLLALMLAEAHRDEGVFDGALALCPIAQGVSRMADNLVDSNLAWQSVQGFRSQWGIPEQIAPDVDFDGDVALVLTNLHNAASQRPLLEFHRLFMTHSATNYYLDSYLDQFWKSTHLLANLQSTVGEPRVAGTPFMDEPSGPAGPSPFLSSTDEAYLTRLGLTLAEVRFMAIQATQAMAGLSPPDPLARKKLLAHGELTGHLGLPTFALFGVEGPSLGAELEYLRAYASASSSEGSLLASAIEIPTDSACQALDPGDETDVAAAFVHGIAALDNWVRTATRPEPGELPSPFLPAFRSAIPTLGRVNLWMESATVTEDLSGAQVVELELRRSHLPLFGAAQQVAVSSRAVSASHGLDFAPLDESVAFTGDSLTTTVSLVIFGDTEPEADETLKLDLAMSAGYGNIVTPVVQVTIEDPLTQPDLADLALSTGSLSPAFDPDIDTYSAAVPGSTESVSVIPIAPFAASIRVDGEVVTSGLPSSPIHLDIGSNPIEVLVTAGNGVSTRTYTVDVVRAGAPTHTAPAPGGAGTIIARITAGGSRCEFTLARHRRFVTEASPTAPPGMAFPYGVFDFTADGCTPGGSIELTLEYPAALPADTEFWKWGPTAAEPSAHWYRVPATIDGNTAVLQVTDGGLGDDDLTVNGRVVDPVGAAIGATSAHTVSTLSRPALLALLLMLVWLAQRRLRKLADRTPVI